jgi:preprotein translocase subunit YajC
MFISPAFAQGAAGGAGGGIMSFLPIILIFVVFYFLLIRPQQKRAKTHREMLGAIRRGDRIVTGGGIMGTVTKVLNDSELAVEIAEGVKIKVQRALVAQVVSKTEPASQAQGGGSQDGGQQGGGGLMGKFLGGGR